MIHSQSSTPDPLGDVVTLLRPTAVLSKPITGRGRWGVRYAAHEPPGFGLVLTGRCWLAIDGVKPVELQAGDFVLLPTSPPFTLSSRPGARTSVGRPSMQPVRHGRQDGEPDFRMLGGTFEIDPVNAPLLRAMLPRLIHLRAADTDTTRLARVVGLIKDECDGDRPGRGLVLASLLDVMLVECLRFQDAGAETLPAGLLRGLREPALASALRAIHADVRSSWTVRELARRAGMSRSAFAARFTEVIGCAPIEYLTRWRMSLAQDVLSRGGQSLTELADAVGYESASAFSTAFRRRIGRAPGGFARSYRVAAAR